MTGFYIIQVFTERCFRTDYGAGFSKISLFFKKKQNNIDSPEDITLPFRLNSSK